MERGFVKNARKKREKEGCGPRKKVTELQYFWEKGVDLGAKRTFFTKDDETVYTFHLREDGVWTNGDPVTANDFAFAWQQALNPDVASDYAYMLFFIKNAEPYLNGE